MHRLQPRMKGVAILAPIVGAERGASLHGVSGDACDEEALSGHVMGAGETGVARRLVAGLVQEAEVVRHLVPDRRCARRQRGRRVGDRGQDLVVDLDELGGVLRLVQRLRDDGGDGIAHVLDASHRQRPVGRHEAGAAVGTLARHARGEVAEAGLDHVLAGEDAEHARRLERHGGVDPADARGGVGRAQHVEMGLARQVDVVGVAPEAAQEVEILRPRHGIAEPQFTHALHLRHCCGRDGATSAGRLSRCLGHARVR